jgi:general secretion pathway protein E
VTRIKKILAACRLDDPNVAVLGCAAALAEKQDAELHLLHVLPKKGGERNVQTEARHTREKLETMLPAEQVMNLKLHCAARQGTVSQSIVDYAEATKIDMIVVGSHHRGRLARVVSTSKPVQILKAASCPVVIVPVDHESTSASLQQMAELLQDTFGDVVPGDREAARGQMRETLERSLNLASDQAESSLQQMEKAKALTWDRSTGEMSTLCGSVWHLQPQAIKGDGNKSVITVNGSKTPMSPATDLLHRACSLRATDIHIDPGHDDESTVRMRIDGQLEHYCDLDADLVSHLLQQFKILANIDIADPFNPHEGWLRLDDPQLNCQIRITTAPVQGGESVCLRLQSETSMLRPLSELGLAENTHDAVTKLLHRGEGLVLVTGPTGSGKTTMVYSMLKELEPCKHHRNIVTIEDPVEFDVPFLRQLSVSDAHGLTLDTGLRTMLRMDPDVIFVGEIRDGATAALAMRAASSGKYVFSTLHTRDVASTVTALRDLNVPATSLAGNLSGIISQRLVRRLCPQCRELRDTTDAERQLLAEHQLDVPSMIYQAVGCDHCRHIGYFGRTGMFEVVVANGAIRESITHNATEKEVRDVIRATGVPSLTADGLSKALNGLTSIEEVQRMRWM